MRSLATWYAVILVACIALAYLLHVRPRNRREWWYVSVTVGFLTWLLLGFAFLRSR